MIIYVDLLIALNLIYDFLILKVVSLVLKRTTSNIKILLSSLIGEVSILFLILNFNYILLIIFKIILAIIMNIVTFKYKSLKYSLINISYFYMISIILGGFIYFLYLKGINYIIIMLLVPLILLIYIIQETRKSINNNIYDVGITFLNNHSINIKGYLDTGNNIKDIVSNKCVIIVNKNIVMNSYKTNKYVYVPIRVVNNNDLLRCIKIKYIIINNKKITNVLVGLSSTKIGIDNVDCLLNNYLRKEIEND